MNQRLQGTWEVITAEGEVDGSVTFSGSRVEAVSSESTYRGEWTYHQDELNAHHVTLAVNEAWVGEERQTFSITTEIDLTLIFTSPNSAYVLQRDGLWTRWNLLEPSVED